MSTTNSLSRTCFLLYGYDLWSQVTCDGEIWYTYAALRSSFAINRRETWWISVKEIEFSCSKLCNKMHNFNLIDYWKLKNAPISHKPFLPARSCLVELEGVRFCIVVVVAPANSNNACAGWRERHSISSVCSKAWQQHAATPEILCYNFQSKYQVKGLVKWNKSQPQHFFASWQFSRRFFVKEVLFFGPGIKNKHLNKDLKMKIVKYLCHPGLDSF
jgi:hypothetical protein